MRLRLAAAVLAVCSAAAPALAEDGLGGRWSGSTRIESGIVSAVLEVTPQAIGKTAGTLAFRGPNEWDCNAWLEYTGSVDGTHAYLPRRQNAEAQSIENACSLKNTYLEIAGGTLRWFKDGQVQLEIPVTAQP